MIQQLAWHTKTVADILNALRSRERGLTNEEAGERLREYGPNQLPDEKTDGVLQIFLLQFRSPLIYLLLAAGSVIFAIGEVIDASVIVAVLIFNAVVGTIQEGRARNTLLALKKFTEASATVRRDGKELTVCDREIIPGDIILLQEGEKVPADARMIFANNLTIDEASLTGESEPVSKTDAVLLNHDLVAADQKNMVFKGTHVLRGNGTALVVATGSLAEIGKIAQKIASLDTEIPLKTNIRHLSRLIIYAVSAISALVFALGIFSGKPVKEMFATVVALSVSVIPEGLPIVMTLVLATGVWRMSKCHALVKRLQAVETLGQTKVIAVDKTGTLTRNEMVIQRVYAGGEMFEITGSGYEPKGDAILNGTIIHALNHLNLLFSAKIAGFSANARLSFVPARRSTRIAEAEVGAGGEHTGAWKVAGDPTEAALLVLSEKIGFYHSAVEQETPKIFELPFDYRRKYHATIRIVDGKNFLTVAGAPEQVLELCQDVWHQDGVEALDQEKRKGIESVLHKLAEDGLRVVACGMNADTDRSIDPDRMPPLAFVSFFGMKDALRAEVPEAVGRVKSADMRVVMITGDHRLTAEVIAKEADIYGEGDLILTGEEIDQMSDDELERNFARATVFARVTPDHKLRIIQAYRRRGEVVAMTGDGVNDAPSLAAADLGVAMGTIGTEVAKEASDIILLDDNFASIVSAAEEGRNIYKTIKKVILYLFSTSFGEALTIIGALMVGYPLPILPAQIIWLNFVTDGFLDVALAMEPKEKGLMRGSFERPKKWIVDGLMTERMFLMALPMAIGTLYLFQGYRATDLAKAWTVSLTLLAVFQWFNAWNCRSEGASIFQTNPFSNKFLIGATITVILLQLLAVYHPLMNRILRTKPLDPYEWLVILLIASSILMIEETRKFFYRRKAHACISDY